MPKKGEFVFTGVTNGSDFAFNTPFVESPGHKQTVHRGQGRRCGRVRGQLLCVDPYHPDSDPVMNSRVVQSFIYGLVSVTVLDIFAYKADDDFSFGMDQAVDYLSPVVDL